MKNGTFYVGLDLGQAQDYSALTVTQAVGEEYHVRHIQRYPLMTAYPQIVESVTDLLTKIKQLGRHTHLLVDATGVGAPVVDMLRDEIADAETGAILYGVQITGGTTARIDWRRRQFDVPKRDLVGVLQILLQNGRLKISASLDFADVLVRELLTFKVKITSTAHDTYGAWREGEHDDVVLAEAIPCWYAETIRPPGVL